MPRRSQQSEPEKLRAKLVKLLRDFRGNLLSDDLRKQVLALIPIFHNLRDIGSSLRGLGGAHSARERILLYLRKYVSTVINGEELMVVAGIGEYARRVRELRVELGWPILSGVTASEQKTDESEEHLTLSKDESVPEMKPDEYILLVDRQDREAAFRWNLAKTIRNESSSVQDKILKFLRANVGKSVTGEELRYVAGDKTEWARRTRELRTQEGWQVVTKPTGRPDLPIGVYLLESERQAQPHDRAIPDRTRREVLKKDGYACTKCGWNRGIWTPDDPRHLEVHHVIHHAKGGGNEAANLITYCNICHDEVHALER